MDLGDAMYADPRAANPAIFIHELVHAAQYGFSKKPLALLSNSLLSRGSEATTSGEVHASMHQANGFYVW